MTKLVCISDTHNYRIFSIPEGDILIHAGDLTSSGTISQMAAGLSWLGSHRDKFKSIVFICGNHDWLGERKPTLTRQMCEDNGIIYLDHEAKVIQGLKFFGSAYTPEFCKWAFNVPRGPKLKALWDEIPNDTDVLVTHGPPMGILDSVNISWNKAKDLGCFDLMRKIEEVRPKVHVFGHIHDSSNTFHDGKTLFCNASICTENYDPINKPFILSV